MSAHRRSATVQLTEHRPASLPIAPHLQPGWRASSRDATASDATWRRHRANSVQDATMSAHKRISTIDADLLSRASLPSVPRECRQMPPPQSTAAGSRRNSRADMVDNWRCKTSVSRGKSVSSEASSSSSSSSISILKTPSRSGGVDRRSSHDSAFSSSYAERDNDETPKALPPLRVTMEPGPIEVLPPLRFSMDPPVKGRSAWRFVLPSPTRSDKTHDVPVDDLPHWFNGSEEDLVVRLGSSTVRSPSPSACSTMSLSTVDEDGNALPALESNDDSSSVASSHAGSPELTSCDLPSPFHAQPVLSKDLFDDDGDDDMKTPLAHQHFAMPMLSAAAPLPCRLPIPSFLTRK